MKSIFWWFLLLAFGCSNPQREGLEEEILRDGGLMLPNEFSYNGRHPLLGSSEMLNPVIELNRRFDDLDPEISDLLADSITYHLYDGSSATVSKSEMISQLEDFMSQYDSANVVINAAIPVIYEDNRHTWVYSWIYEEYFRNGEKISRYLHEDFRLENGKIRVLYQFKRDETPE